MEKIGIIGGAGVAATNKLNDLIESTLTKNGAYRDCHHPEIIIYQATKTPSRSMYLEGKGDSFIDDYIEIAKKLNLAGATKICMCCNTAHFAIEEIERKTALPFINMIEAVVIKAQKANKKNIGLVASDGCLMGEVYEKYFQRIFSTANIYYPDADIQKAVTKGICNIKNQSRFLAQNAVERPCSIFKNVCDHLFHKGAELIIIGCTDIRVDFKMANTIDSLETLAECILYECFNKKYEIK
jgi:aspartate racemase